MWLWMERLFVLVGVGEVGPMSEEEMHRGCRQGILTDNHKNDNIHVCRIRCRRGTHSNAVPVC